MNDEHTPIAPEETPDSPPPSGKSGRSGNNRVLLGCGIGCGVLLFLGVVAVIAMIVAGSYGLRQFDEQARPVLEREYAAWKDAGVITEEQQPVYDELRDAIYDEELGSGWVTLCVLVVMVYHTDDGTVTEEELADAKQLLTDIQNDPGLGFGYWMGFANREELQEAFQTAAGMVQRS